MIRAVIYDFHRTLALPPGGTIWRRSLFAELAAVTYDSALIGEHLEAGFPWCFPEQRRDHGSAAAARAWFVDLLARSCEAGGVAVATSRSAAERAYLRVTHPTESNKLYPETLLVLQAVAARGIRQVVLSNHVWELPDICQALGLVPPLAEVLSSARLGVEKPHPESYAQALRACRCKPHEVLFVGDTYETDVAGPERAGIHALLVRRPVGGTCRYADDLTGVVTAIDSLGA